MIPVTFFDGRSSRAHPATLAVEAQQAVLRDDSGATLRRALLAGEDGLPAAALAQLAGLSLPRAAHMFQELMQAEVVALSIRERQVCYVLRPGARCAMRWAISTAAAWPTDPCGVAGRRLARPGSTAVPPARAPAAGYFRTSFNARSRAASLSSMSR